MARLPKLPKNVSVVLMVVCALTTIVFTASALEGPAHEVESHIRDHVSNTKSLHLEPKDDAQPDEEAVRECEADLADPNKCQNPPAKPPPTDKGQTPAARMNLEGQETDDQPSQTIKPAKGLRRIKQIFQPVTQFVSDCSWTMLAAIATLLMMLWSLISWIMEPANVPPKLSGSLPLVGNLVEFVGGPLDMIRRGLKDHGAVFTAKIATEKMTFLIGPEESAAFYRGNDKTVGQVSDHTRYLDWTVLYSKQRHCR